MTRGPCTHTADGDPGHRLRGAGYLSWTWGENIGYGSRTRLVLDFLRRSRVPTSGPAR